MNPLVSIIVPVYNAGKYLRRCVDSLIAQTYENIEILLVDDGSTDGSGAICEEYAKDKRVRVFHQENRGISAARNVGLDIMRGEYLMFVDDDDYVSPEYVRKPVEIIKCPRGGDIVCFPFYEERQGGLRLVRDACYDWNFKTVLDIQKALIVGQISGLIWDKLYRSTLWDTLRFPIGRYAEDMFVLPYVVIKAQNILFLDDPLYYHNRNNVSSTSLWAEKNTKLNFDVFLAQIEKANVVKNLGDDALARKMYGCAISSAIHLCYRNYYYEDIPDSDYADLQAFFQSAQTKENLRSCRFDIQLKHWLMKYVPAVARFYGRRRYRAKARKHEQMIASMKQYNEGHSR